MSSEGLILTKEEMSTLDEAALRTRVIIPLLEAIGYQHVYHNHGSGELGKDIVAWKQGDLGTPVNLAVVAKAGRISGNVAIEVARQVRQVFHTTYLDSVDNQPRRAHFVWVITNGEIAPSSKGQVLAEFSVEQHDRLQWIDINKLWQLWCDHFNVGFSQALSDVQRQVEQFNDPAISVQAWADQSGRGITAKVVNPDMLTEKHVKGHGKFRFPDTSEGQAKLRELEAAWKTGTPVELPRDFFELQLPEVLQRIMKEAFGIAGNDFTSMTISPADDARRFPVKVELICDDGESTTLDYIDWRISQSGTEEVTMVNDEQPIPIRYKMTLPSSRREGRYDFELVNTPVSAAWLLKWIELQRCLAKAGELRITLVSSGERLATARRNERMDIIDLTEDYGLVKELAAAEKLLGEPIIVPDGELTPEEKTTIGILRQLLRNPERSGTWSDETMGFYRQDIEERLSRFLMGESGSLNSVADEIVTLGGRQLNLGPVEYIFESAKLADIDESQRLIAGVEDKQAVVSLRFVPADNNTIVLRYQRWIDAVAAAPYRIHLPNESTDSS